MCTELHDNRADDAHQPGGGKAHQRSCRKCLQNVVEQPLYTAREHAFFTLLRVVTLHHADSAERFGQAPCDFRVDLRPRAENRPNRRKCFINSEPEDQQDAERDRGHGHARVNQVHQRDHRGHDSADKLNKARANKISYAFHVAHDSRDQRASLVGVVEGDRKPADVRLHLASQVRNHFLRGLRKQLRQRKRRQSLDNRRGEDAQHDWRQQLDLPLADDVVHQILRGSRQHQSR